MQRVARDAGVDLRLTRPPSPVRVDVDADTAERILVPLIENGCRYGRSRVEVQVNPNGDSVEFLVHDDGPGVDAAETDRIFEPGVPAGRGLGRRMGGRAGTGARPPSRAGGRRRRRGAPERRGASFRARIPQARAR